MKSKILAGIILSLMLLTACEEKSGNVTNQANQNNLVMATLYNYYAAEYKALCYQAYNVAKERVKITRKLNPKKDNLAVVVDIDETILNYSPFEAKLILDKATFNFEDWVKWGNLEVAEPVPGALEFLKFADSLGYHIFYITNKTEKFEKKSTLGNLGKLGFPQLEASHLLFGKSGESKENRRKSISENYTIVLFAGDNLGDFYDDSSDYNTRDSLMMANKANFGKKFIVLPNAMYGRWSNCLGINRSDKVVDSLLKEMVSKYYP